MLNVAIIGAGSMGRAHGNSYRNVDGAKVVAVCDIMEEKAEEIAGVHGAKSYTDFDRMLEEENIDMVDICLPTYLHREAALKAINKGKHIFCEKPVANAVEDAKLMLDKAYERNVKFSVGQVVRFFPAYMHAVEIVAQGRIGTPKLIRTTRTGAYPSQGFNNWYADPLLSGGVLMDLVIHDFDWIRHNFGEVDRVYAKNLINKTGGNFDHCLVTLRLKNGAIAHVEGSWAYPAGSVFGTTFEVVGTKGQIEFDSRASVPLRKHLRVDGVEKVFSESPLVAREEPYTAELQEFVNCIVENREPAVSPYEAVKALEISVAAIRSADTGEAVVLGG